MTEVSQARINHFRERLGMRHGVTLSDDALQLFCEKIRSKRPAIKLNCRLGVYRIDLFLKSVAVLWDRKHDIPITALPDDAVIFGERGRYRWRNGSFEQMKGQRK